MLPLCHKILEALSSIFEQILNLYFIIIQTYGISTQGLAIKQGILPELAEEDLELTKVIGRGAYGDVYEGVLKDRETGEQHNVAIKSLKSRCKWIEFRAK